MNTDYSFAFVVSASPLNELTLEELYSLHVAIDGARHIIRILFLQDILSDHESSVQLDKLAVSYDAATAMIDRRCMN